VLPDHAPDSEQLVALLDDQDRLELCPFAIVVGLATSDTVGADVTVTVVDLEIVPPPPEQLSVYVAVLVGYIVALPLTERLPLQPPEATQLVA
jgi:hypothetical protein